MVDCNHSNSYKILWSDSEKIESPPHPCYKRNTTSNIIIHEPYVQKSIHFQYRKHVIVKVEIKPTNEILNELIILAGAHARVRRAEKIEIHVFSQSFGTRL